MKRRKTTKLIYSNKPISKLVLKRFPDYFEGVSKTITPLYFDKFNTKQDDNKKLFALRGKLKNMQITKEDYRNAKRIIIFCYRYKGDVLYLDKSLRDLIKNEFGFYEVLDEASLSEHTQDRKGEQVKQT